jgi:phenylpropionate dioxygenase-like ring-hydroxylating dioxygenase large terminal subunit
MSLTADYYCNNKIFKDEIDLIFKSDWIFAGLTTHLQNHLDFITFEIGNIPIVIQNKHGVIKAFQNICTHRFNKILTSTQGSSPLTCSYHNWSFNDEGFPQNAFNNKEFQFSESDKECLKLKQYNVAVVGKFIFINLSTSTTSISDYLGKWQLELESISTHIGNEYYNGNLPHHCNWKLMVENVLECYHCSSIHHNTLYGKFGIGHKRIEHIEYLNLHSKCHFPKKENFNSNVDPKQLKLLAFLDERGMKHESFYHFFIYPNLFLSSTEGKSFYIGQLLPINAEQSNLKIHFYEPFLESTKNKAIREIIGEEVVSKSIEILNEDKVVLEQVQRNMPIKEMATPFLSNEEERIQKFHSSYKLNMKLK